MATQLTARRPDGRYMDDDTLRNAGLDDSNVGQYAVVQLGGICIGFGDTEEAAIADAERCASEALTMDTENLTDDSLVCVLIEAED